MWCHVVLFGMPLLGLPLFWLLPLPLALAVYAPLSAVSVGFGLIVMRALRAPVSTGAPALRGRWGRVVAVDGRAAMVRLDGDAELWQAASPGPLAPGQAVDVLDVDGLTLIVGPREAAGEARRDGEGGGVPADAAGRAAG